MGKMTLTISFNFFTVKTAELQFLFIFTTPTPNVLAAPAKSPPLVETIFFLRTPMSSKCKFILNTKLTEVQLLLG